MAGCYFVLCMSSFIQGYVKISFLLRSSQSDRLGLVALEKSRFTRWRTISSCAETVRHCFSIQSSTSRFQSLGMSMALGCEELIPLCESTDTLEAEHEGVGHSGEMGEWGEKILLPSGEGIAQVGLF